MTHFYKVYLKTTKGIRMYKAFKSLKDAQTTIQHFTGSNDSMSISEQTFMRYAVISETFNSIGECTSHAIVLETDNYIDAKGAAEKERHKAVQTAGDLPQVYVIDRMEGVKA